MVSNSEYLMSFLEGANSVAAQTAKKMEDLMFEDPSSSIVKARVFIEEILKEVFKKEDEAPYLTSLYDKISYLAKEGVIKRDIQQSFDTIRLSGNKAAHNAKFNDITEAYKLHKEMYKIAVWFYEVYSSAQTKVPLYDIPKPRQKDNIEDLVRKQILEMLGTGSIEVSQLQPNIPSIVEEPKGDTGLLLKDLGERESYLLRELTRLKDSSQEAIENANQFSSFKNYLHVDRKIQLDLERILAANKERQGGSLILLCGSVGDGKSHLLAYLKKNKPELMDDYTIFNDATESFSPNKNAMETLEEVLKNFSDQKLKDCNDNIILAINMGVLHNFINTEHNKYSYESLKVFVEESELFSQKITTHYSKDKFDLLSFGDYHSYELTANGTISTFYSTLLKKVCAKTDQNPFNLALREDGKKNINTMVHENYKFLQNEFVQEQVVQLIIRTIIQHKLVISARAFLNLIADILIPDEVINKNLINEFDVLDHALPNLIFNRKERSEILKALSSLDPIHLRSKYIDETIVDLNTLSNWSTIISGNVLDEIGSNWFSSFNSKSDISGHTFNVFFESFLRITYLTNKEFVGKIKDKSYTEFIKNLYGFNTADKKTIRNFYDEMKNTIHKWKGTPKKDYVYLDQAANKYRLAQKLNLRPTIDHLHESTTEVLDTFKSSIVVGYRDENNKLLLEIDYKLYQLLMKVQEGYRPNKKDEEDAINFVEFVDKLMNFGDKKKELLVHFPKDNRSYILKRDEFESFVFEREN
ncbi:DNA phosphorothioation-dependent restriction protein DptF [Bacillus sp. RO2]|uniref:DNA phosphorothioation-dependent restriction protein DptF n=1 Tax=Bacillus sp. RO2 TaxID=2723913 RepID=UPI00145DBD87|nr:DNA phosphorothioation-dependent restriction protein DptF [Bacillus sp. RO2]NMH73563.1 DNA phosphorothioation-dependent restriction protein DptF [Bacillus sp. RO2]